MNFRDKNFIRNSKHFCLLPWLMVKVDKDNGVKPCCLMTESHPYGSLAEETLSRIWNGEAIRDLRRRMLEDAPFSPCSICYETEASGETSFRQEVNQEFEAIGEKILQETPDALDPRAPAGPVMLELRFSNLCNFRCRTCNPAESSGWSSDAEAFGHTGAEVTRLTDDFESTWSWIEPLLPDLRRIYLLGGEPLLIEDHYLFLERLIRAGRTAIPIRYNTNLSRFTLRQWNALELWNRFESIHLSISVDAIGEQAELLRKGTVWSEIERNFLNLRKTAPRVDYQIYPTVSVMNAFHLTTALDHWLSSGWIERPEHFRINFLQQPRRFSIRILNEEERKALVENYEGFLSRIQGRTDPALHAELSHQLRTILGFLAQGSWPDERRNFRKITFKLDQLRRERFVVLFPELFNTLYGSERPQDA